MIKKNSDKSIVKTGTANFDNEYVENELRKSEANHRLIFQNSALAQLICTQKEQHIVKANEAALDLYGYSEDEFLRLDIRQLRMPSDRAALQERVDAALRLEKPPKYIVTHVKKNGQQLIVEVSAAKMDYDG